jgi:general secretion pathway protein J
MPLWDDFSSDPNSGIRLFSFQGRTDGFQFASHFPASAGKPGAQHINIQLTKDDEDGQVLNVVLTPFFPITEGETWDKEEVVLVKHVAKLELHYFGADDQASEPYWQDQWIEKEFQPRLVKIKIQLDNGIFWPEMLIDVKATISAESAGFSQEVNTTNTGQ